MSVSVGVIGTKGGIGKTTIVANLGAILADMGFRVLIIDADPQASVSKYFKLHHKAPNGIVEFLLGENSTDLMRSVISKTVFPNLDIILSNDFKDDVRRRVDERIDRAFLVMSKLVMPFFDKSYQRRNEFNAVGKYQMVETTFREAVKALDLKGNEKFTPALQERIFNDYLLKKAGGGAAWDYIHGKHNDINEALVALAKEWAAFPVPATMKGHVGQVQAGQSYYHGHNGNKARLSINQARAALMDARK